MKKILVADDEADIRQLLKDALELEGYETITAENGMETVARLDARPDLILLDINMPDMDGYQICRAIRDYVSVPILFLTARTEEADRVQGLRAGGDDYIVKPFSMEELLARIEAHFRREERTVKRIVENTRNQGNDSDKDPGQSRHGLAPIVFQSGENPDLCQRQDKRCGSQGKENPDGYPDWRREVEKSASQKDRGREQIGEGLVIDYPGQRILKDDYDICLTKTEYRIAELLYENRGRVFGREQIYERVRGFDSSGDAGIVTEHIRRIRKKLGSPDGSEWIETVWGVGYRWIGQ